MPNPLSILRPPPPPETWAEFATRLRLPDGPYQGQPWNPDSEPAQAAAIRAMDNGQWKRFVFVWSQQCGKSLIGMLLPAIKSTCNDRLKCGYVLPTLEVLDRNWVDKIKPGYEGTGFGDWLPEKGPGSRGGRPKALAFRNPQTGAKAGSLVFFAAGTVTGKETNLASSTVNPVLIDEGDDFADLQHIKLAEGRASAFGPDARSYISSTVNKDEDSLILHLWETATAGRLWYPCPHCGAYQPFDLERIAYHGEDEETVIESARLVCKHNGCAITETERHEALRSWKYVGRGQSVDDSGAVMGAPLAGDQWSLLAGQLDFHLGYGVGALASQHFAAQRAIDTLGDHSAMRYYYQKRHSRQYEGDNVSIKITNKGLAALSKQGQNYKAQVPEWADFLTMSVDVQRTRAYYMIIAHGKDARFHVVDWGYECFGGQYEEREHSEEEWLETFDLLESYRLNGWQIGTSDEKMIPCRAGIDTGYKEDVVFQWIDAHNGWHGLKGRSKEPRKGRTEDESVKGSKTLATLRNWVEVRRLENGRKLWFVDTSPARLAVHRGLLLDPEAPASGSIPRGSDGEPLKSTDPLCMHLSAEIWTQDESTGKWFWRQAAGQKRNDLLDCAVYALALGRFEQEHRGKKKKKRRGGVVGGME